jgi:spermidine/putrescine-binding protein
MAILIILLGIGTGLLSLGLYSRMTTARTSHEIGARCAADAGLTNAVYVMNQKLIAGNWSDSTVPSVADATLPSCDATFSYKVVAKSITSNRDFDVACIGRG